MTLGIAFAFYFAALLPILWANRYHLEDWRRLIRGSYGWSGEGRPITDLLLWILNSGGPLLDISPIPQIMGVAALALLTALLAQRFRLPPLQSALSLLPLGASPFFLDNLSFRFDAIAMCFALALAILPIAVDKPNGFVHRCVFGAACLTVSLCCYQTGINGFFVFAIAEIALYFERAADPKELVNKLWLRGIQLGIALLSYELIVKLTVTGTYNIDHVTLVSRPEDLHAIQENWRAMWWQIYHALPGTVRNIYITAFALATVALVSLGFGYARRIHGRGRPLGAVAIASASLILPWMWLVGSLGPALLPLHSVLTLPRIFVGTGALLAASFLVLCVALRHVRLSGKVVCALLAFPAYPLFMLAAVFGNVQREQALYEDRIASELTSAIDTIRRDKAVTTLIIDGVVPYCPIAQEAVKKYRILKVPRNLTSDQELGIYTHHVFEYYGINLPYETSAQRRADVINLCADTRPLVQNGYYDLFLIEKTIVVRFLGDIQLTFAN
jgi:hypothetical protein